MKYHNLNKCKLTFAKQTVNSLPSCHPALRKCVAFTLAELLITLAIIGVVAALTIHVLVDKYQKAVTVNKLKVEYSKFATLIARSVEDNGPASNWIAEFDGVDNLERAKLVAEKYIIPYIDGGAKTFKQYEYDTVWSLGGEQSFFSHYVGKPYRIKNGTIFLLSATPSYNLVLLLDIDNKITKNRVGKDVFAFEINSNTNKLVPMGMEFSRGILTGVDKDRWCKPPECKANTWISGWSACNKGNSDRYSGAYCAALIMQDGWKISPDYPW